jgi:DNA-directed RNA polymerase specialized sigma24 family protein
MKKSSRVCALCDTVIPDSHVVCKEHYEEYKLYKDEPWFKELASAARRQFEIDNEETAIQMGDFSKITQTRRKLTESEKKLIIQYVKKGIGSINIAKILDLNSNTVESFIQRYKKSSCN